MEPRGYKQLKWILASNEIKAVIKSFPMKRNPKLDRFTAKFFQAFKEELKTMLL
jgi:hypothetical protein